MFCDCDNRINCIIEFQPINRKIEQCNRCAVCEECFFKRLVPILIEKYKNMPHIVNKLQPFCTTYAPICEECTYESIELAEITLQKTLQ